MVKITVPGKVHLIGEHAVVYGEPAIIAAVGLRNFVEAERSDGVSFSDENMEAKAEFPAEEARRFSEEMDSLWEECSGKGDFSELFSYFKNDNINFKKACIGKSLRELGIDGGVRLRIGGDVPRGSGLGSSAALAVAIPKAIAGLYGKDVSLERINEIAFSLERLVHGMPSGGDNSTCAFGGLVWFVKGSPNTIQSMREEVPHKLENFVLAYIKRPEKTTGELVQMVRNLEPGFRDKRIKSIGRATHEMREALRSRDYPRVRELINLAWKNLSELGLSVPEADELIARIVGMGGAAKLCGACGGGMMLAQHDDVEALKSVIREAGFEPMEVELAVEGAGAE